MSPLFMETGYELNSPGSVSAGSNTPGSEREGEGQLTGKRGSRTEKNRNAARKSRRKQTERADELHEELQSLERSNSAMKREIAALKKDLHLYTTVLERHKPCFLKDSSSSSTTQLSVSPSAACQAGPSPPGAPPRASSFTSAAATPLSNSNLGLVESTHFSSSPPPTTSTLALPSGSSTELFTSSSSVAPPHSLFSELPPPIITSRPTNVPPVCTSLVSNPVPSISLPAAAQPQSARGNIYESFSMSAITCFSPLPSDALDAFLMKEASFIPASSNVVPPYSHLAAESAGLVAQGSPMNVHQLHPGQLSRNSSPPCSLLPLSLQDAAPQSLSAPPPAPAYDLRPSYSRQVTLNNESLLSLFTVPSPLHVPQTTSSSFYGPLPQPPPSLPQVGDPPRDLSLSELLEGNDWILSGTNH